MQLTDTNKTPSFPWWHLIIIVLIGAIGRALLIGSGSISFHADEGIVALMARHMTQGEFPIFFYGQPYMGSLNAMSTALGFATLGESVLTIRIVQWVKFVLVIATGYWAAWHLSRRWVVAFVAGMTIAISHTMGAIYTATNIGGYAETLIFGHLLLILGYDVARVRLFSMWRWVLLGLIAGLAWWTNALIIMIALPVALFIFWTLFQQVKHKWRYFGLMVLALAMFFVGGAPYWIYDITHNNAAIGIFLPFIESDSLITPFEAPLSQKLLGLVLFGIPTSIGLRYTWATDFFLPIVGIPVLFIYIAAIYQLTRTNEPPLRNGVRPLIFSIPVMLLVIFLASSFGADPTGRYFLPLLLPFGMMLGTFSETLRENIKIPYLWAVPAVIVVAYNAAGQINAAVENDPGITTQFELIIHIPHTYDDELIEFLLENDLRHGYTTYWVAIRMAFLSQEQLQYSSALPYKPALTYTPADNRYPPYAEATENADNIAYINTTFLPELDTILEEQFAAAGVTYDVAQIGHFVVYHNFEPEAPRVRFLGEEVTLIE